ncbi:hypothetical protein Tco_1396798 [Tanacetum coccineum]
MGLWYSKDVGFELISYSNADLVGCNDDCKSTSGGFHELVQLCPEMVPSERKKIEAYFRGLTNNIKGTVIGSKPTSLNEAVRMGYFQPPKFDLSNSGLEEFQQPEFEGYGPKTSKSVSEDISNEVRESPDALLVKELVSDDKLEKKTAFPTVAKIEFVRPKQ